MTELSAPARLGVFGAALTVVLAAAFGIGRVTGDVAQAGSAGDAYSDAAGAHDGHGSTADGEQPGSAHGDAAGGHGASVPSDVAGTSLSAGGMRLDVPTTTLPAGRVTSFTFRVLDENSRPVTEFDLEQDKLLHLIVVSRDLSRHAHVHPELAADGTWSVDLTLSPGSYRGVADFSAKGERRSLAVDLAVPGPLTVAPLPPPAPTAAVSGLRIELERTGDELSFTVFDRAGQPVVPEPYLGARGHLVAFRSGDLAYTHVHPSGERGATTSYTAELPGPGSYGLFLEVKVDGTVHTAAYTLEVKA